MITKGRYLNTIKRYLDETDMKKISIIVPVYNAVNTLEKCIDSLINQTYSNIEIILINDGSVDDSLSVLIVGS